jgi:hypothetical protein
LQLIKQRQSLFRHSKDQRVEVKTQTNLFLLSEHEEFKEMLASAIIFAAAVALVSANNAPTYPSDVSSTAGNSYESYPPFNGAKVPQNGKPSNSSYPDDGCGDYSVRFKGDGYCYPLLKKGPCENVLFWITVDPYTYEVGFFFNN